MKLQKVKMSIGRQSLVGVSDKTFPLKYGNYCYNPDGLYFCNIWAENLRYLISSGLIEQELEALVFDDSDGNPAYIYVLEESVPDGFLHEPYFCSIRTAPEILRHHFNVPDDKCLCEVDEYKHINYNMFHSNGIKSGKCSQCDTRFVVQGKRKSGVYSAKLANSHFLEFVYYDSNKNKFHSFPGYHVIDDALIVGVSQEKLELENLKDPITGKEFTFTGLIKRG